MRHEVKEEQLCFCDQESDDVLFLNESRFGANQLIELFNDSCTIV